MKTYEIGVLPESEWFFFSPAEDTRQMFYYHTMCGHFYCNRDYYIKRDTYPPLLLVYVKAGTFCLELSGKQYEVNAGQIAFFDCQQPHYYHGHMSESVMEVQPDFVKLVESYGHVGLRATTYEELDRCIEEAFGKYKDDLVFIDVHIEREEPVRPMVGPGQGLTEMVLSEEK